MGIYGIGQPMQNAYYVSHPGQTNPAGAQAANAAVVNGMNGSGAGAVSGMVIGNGKATANGTAIGNGKATANGTAIGNGTVTGRPMTSAEMQALKKMGAVECQTCKSRTYQDGSNDPGVSFKAPGHIDPASSGATVRAHEQEHVANEQAKARAEGKRVVSQSVRIFMSICTECGRAYASGGLTRTVTASNGNKNRGISQYNKSKAPSPGSRVNSAI
jgi:hypothetical protein